MRKLLMMTLAAAALALALPATGSAAPSAQGGAVKAAADSVAGIEQVQHGRRWSHRRWGSGGRAHSRWESRGRRHSRWESRGGRHSRWESRRRWR